MRVKLKDINYLLKAFEYVDLAVNECIILKNSSTYEFYKDYYVEEIFDLYDNGLRIALTKESEEHES